MFGQELVKLTVLDTVFMIGTTFVGDFGRAVFLRVLNPCWFWDLEKKFPKYPDFKVSGFRLEFNATEQFFYATGRREHPAPCE